MRPKKKKTNFLFVFCFVSQNFPSVPKKLFFTGNSVFLKKKNPNNSTHLDLKKKPHQLPITFNHGSYGQ